MFRYLAGVYLDIQVGNSGDGGIKNTGLGLTGVIKLKEENMEWVEKRAKGRKTNYH